MRGVEGEGGGGLVVVAEHRRSVGVEGGERHSKGACDGLSCMCSWPHVGGCGCGLLVRAVSIVPWRGVCAEGAVLQGQDAQPQGRQARTEVKHGPGRCGCPLAARGLGLGLLGL